MVTRESKTECRMNVVSDLKTVISNINSLLEQNAKLRVKKSVSTVYIFILCFIGFKFLMKVNEIKIKKGVDLAQHLVDFYDAQVT